jgi:hypothetical protein
LGVCPLPPVENQWQNKHVEGLCIACLDEGSNPSNSTDNEKEKTFVFSFLVFGILLISCVQLIAGVGILLTAVKQTRPEIFFSMI